MVLRINIWLLLVLISYRLLIITIYSLIILKWYNAEMLTATVPEEVLRQKGAQGHRYFQLSTFGYGLEGS